MERAASTPTIDRGDIGARKGLLTAALNTWGGSGIKSRERGARTIADRLDRQRPIR
jgi:hypothetical protein